MATPTPTTATDATAITNNNPTQQENPDKTLDPTAPIPQPDPTPADKEAIADESKETPADPGNDAPLSDVQKKIRRAERFGISVQLSEKEKRNSRAERSNPPILSLPLYLVIPFRFVSKKINGT